MANTPVKFARAYDTSLTVKLVAAGGSGTPNGSGYACTNSNGFQSFTVAEALTGAFYAYAYDSENEIAYQGFVLLVDTTATHYCLDDLTTAIASDKLRKFFTNAREPISGAATGYQRFRVYEDDGTTTAFDLDWKTSDGTIEPV